MLIVSGHDGSRMTRYLLYGEVDLSNGGQVHTHYPNASLIA